MTTDTEARAAFLRALAADDFLPDTDAVAAAAEATGATLPHEPASDRLRDAVEEFASAYWSRTPEERHRDWKELSARCGPADRAAKARLRHLRAGLNVEPADHGDPTANALAPVLRELYVLPARDRAVRRHAWLRQRGGVPREWGNAAKKLQTEAAKLVALEPLLAHRLIAAAWPPKPARSSTGPLRFTESDLPKVEPEFVWKPVLWTVGILLYILFRAASSGDGTSTRRTPAVPQFQMTPYQMPSMPTPPVFTPPPLFTHEPGDTGMPSSFLFTAGEVATFKRYERDAGPRTPPRYELWVTFGRPEASNPPGTPRVRP